MDQQGLDAVRFPEFLDVAFRRTLLKDGMEGVLEAVVATEKGLGLVACLPVELLYFPLRPPDLIEVFFGPLTLALFQSGSKVHRSLGRKWWWFD